MASVATLAGPPCLTEPGAVAMLKTGEAEALLLHELAPLFMRPGPRFINVRRNLCLSVFYVTQIYGAQMMPFHKDTNGFVYTGVNICCCVKYQVCVIIG